MQDKYAAGAFYWKFKKEAYSSYMKLDRPVVALNFDRLTTESEPALRAITAFIGVQWKSTLLNHDRLVHSELDGQGKAVGGTDWQRAINHASAGRRRTLFAQSAVD